MRRPFLDSFAVFASSAHLTFPWFFFNSMLISWVDLSLVLLLYFYSARMTFPWFFLLYSYFMGRPFSFLFYIFPILWDDLSLFLLHFSYSMGRPFSRSFTLFLFYWTTFPLDPLIRGWPRQPCSPAGGHHPAAGGHSSRHLGTYAHKLFKGTVWREH